MDYKSSVRIESAELIKYLLVTRDLTAQEFCGILDVSRAQFYKLKNNSCKLTLGKSILIEDYFDIKISRQHKGLVEEDSKSSLFYLPQQYKHDQHSRQILHFFSCLLKKFLGETHYQKFLNYERLPAEYFVNFNHKINIRFTLRIMEELVTKRIMNKANLKYFAREFCTYFKIPSGSVGAFLQVFSNMSRFESNHHYMIEEVNKSKAIVSYSLENHIPLDLYYSPILNDFMMEWLISVIEVLSGKEAAVLESKHTGSLKCVISIAS